MKNAALAVFIGLLVVACSGLRGKADALYEKGAYFEAIQTYEAALQQSPRDEDALAGLRKARGMYLDKKLIEVRKARLGTNRQLAIDTLLELVKNETQWDFFPGGAIAVTQEEESIESMRFVEAQMNDSITKDRPLWGLYLLNHYQPIFSGSLSTRREFLLRQLSKTGVKQCDNLVRNENAQQPYFSEFVRKVCTAWGLADKGKASGRTGKRAALYRSIRVDAQIANLGKPYRSALAGALENAFQQTPWFDPEGARSVPLTLSGDFRIVHETTPEVRIHGYTVQIPYTDYQNVTKTRQVSYVEYVDNCHWDSVTNTNICNPQHVTRYRDETYSDTEPVTRYRSEPRSQRYDGINHHQALELHAQGELKLGKLTKPLRLDASAQKDGFEHHFNLPSVGLSPEDPNLIDPNAWVSHQAEQLGADLRAHAEDLWIGQYCQPMSTEPTLVATGDSVHRCLRLTYKSPPAFADSWYSRFFGLNVAQADELLKLSDL
jgi:tetratricopeptide (TPR) repeat protein